MHPTCAPNPVIIAILVLSVSLLLATQMVCSTWRDIQTERIEATLEIARHPDLYNQNLHP